MTKSSNQKRIVTSLYIKELNEVLLILFHVINIPLLINQLLSSNDKQKCFATPDQSQGIRGGKTSIGNQRKTNSTMSRSIDVKVLPPTTSTSQFLQISTPAAYKIIETPKLTFFSYDNQKSAYHQPEDEARKRKQIEMYFINQQNSKQSLQSLGQQLLKNERIYLFVMRNIQKHLFNRDQNHQADSFKKNKLNEISNASQNLFSQIKLKFFSFLSTESNKNNNEKYIFVTKKYKWIQNQLEQVEDALSDYFLEQYSGKISPFQWVCQFFSGELYRDYHHQAQMISKTIKIEDINFNFIILRFLYFICIHIQLKSIRESGQTPERKNFPYFEFNREQICLNKQQLVFHCQNILSKLKISNIQKLHDQSYLVDHRNQQSIVGFKFEQQSSQPILDESSNLCWSPKDLNIRFRFVLDLIRVLNKLVDNGIGIEFKRQNVCQKHNSLLVKFLQPFSITKPLEQIEANNKQLHLALQQMVDNFYQISLGQKKNQKQRNEEKCSNAKLIRQAIHKFIPLYPYKSKQQDYYKHFYVIQNNIQFILKLIGKLFGESQAIFYRNSKVSLIEALKLANTKVQFQKIKVEELAKSIEQSQNQLNSVNSNQARQSQPKSHEKGEVKLETSQAKRFQIIQKYLKLKIQQIYFYFFKAFYKDLNYQEFSCAMAMTFYNNTSLNNFHDSTEEYLQSSIYSALSNPAYKFFEHQGKKTSGIIRYQIKIDESPKFIQLTRQQFKQGNEFILHGRSLQSAQKLLICLLFPQKWLERTLQEEIKNQQSQFNNKDKSAQNMQTHQQISKPKQVKRLQHYRRYWKFMKQEQIITQSIKIFVRIIRKAIVNMTAHNIKLPLLTINHLVMIIKDHAENQKNSPGTPIKHPFVVPKLMCYKLRSMKVSLIKFLTSIALRKSNYEIYLNSQSQDQKSTIILSI